MIREALVEIFPTGNRINDRAAHIVEKKIISADGHVRLYDTIDSEISLPAVYDVIATRRSGKKWGEL